jgi:hypothetical protein
MFVVSALYHAIATNYASFGFWQARLLKAKTIAECPINAKKYCACISFLSARVAVWAHQPG